MRITARGVLDYLDYADRMKLLEQQRQDEKEATVISLISKYGLGGSGGSTLASATGTKSGKSEGLGSSLETDLIRLQDDFDLSAEILAPILASGDKTAIPRLRTLLEEQKEKYVEDNRSFPTELAKNIVENAAIELPSVNEVDFSVYEDYIGREMDSLYKSIFTSTFGSTPGSVAFENISYAEPVDINEIPKVMSTVAKSHAGLAQSELSMLRSREKQLENIPNMTDQQRNEFTALAERMKNITSAVENLAENPSLIINLYGNSYVRKLLESPGGEKYKTVPLSPLLTDAEYEYPLVASEEIGKALVSAGILAEGTVARLPSTGRGKPGELIELVKE